MEIPAFSSPEEELRFLREKVAEREQALTRSSEAPAGKQEAVISATITDYAKSSERIPEEHPVLEDPKYEHVLERMASVPHKEKMRELYHILAEKGVRSSIRMVESLGNPHLEDDFHGVLVDYVKTGSVVPGLDRESELSTLLHMSLFEVTLPFAGMQEGAREVGFREVIAAMERFYLGMLPLESAPISSYGHFSLEVVLSNFSTEIVFYMAVEEHMKDLFMKQLIGSFPTAKIEEHQGDYNIFNEYGASVGSYAEFTNNFVFPIGAEGESEQDPFTTILNAFTKIERNGEGAAIQLLVYPDPDKVLGKVKYALGQIKQGVSVSRATDIPLSAGATIVKGFTEFFHTQVKKEKKDQAPDQNASDSAAKATTLIEEKIAAPILRANLRVVVSAADRDRAEAIRLSIESAFNQFTRPQSNALKFKHVEKGELTELLRKFTYRDVDDEQALIFNTKELSTLYHLPMHISQKDAPQLKTVKASSAPAPTDLPSEGTVIGVNKFRGEEHEIRLTKPDRLRHLYVIGQTGAGKSVFLKSLILQDIKQGSGACFIDPHGSDVQEVLSAIPKERIDDVIYFDPSYMPRPFALNMLEYDVNHPEQKIFVVNEMLAIFKKLYSSSPESMGPAFEQYFRNATMLVMEDPESGNTLLDIPRVLADANYRNLKLSRCKNPLVVQFWRDIATKTSGEAGLQNMIPYITNKFDVFIQNDIMRPIIAQEKSSFNFREIMDQKKILLVNLSKGKLGEMNANLIGLILIGKFLMAAMSRVDSFGQKLPDFYLYVDEFQNVATPSISAILSEARKYGLSLNIAHQFIGQLPEDIKDAVFGNVGNMVTFRVGTEDAAFLEPQYAPIFKASDIMKIENLNAYAKILINGKPVPPFNISLVMPPRGNPDILEQLRQLSYLKYGHDRKSVDDAIMKRYLTPPTSPQAGAQAPRPASPAQTPPGANQFAQAMVRAQVATPPPAQAPLQQPVQVQAPAVPSAPPPVPAVPSPEPLPPQPSAVVPSAPPPRPPLSSQSVDPIGEAILAAASDPAPAPPPQSLPRTRKNDTFDPLIRRASALSSAAGSAAGYIAPPPPPAPASLPQVVPSLDSVLAGIPSSPAPLTRTSPPQPPAPSSPEPDDAPLFSRDERRPIAPMPAPSAGTGAVSSPFMEGSDEVIGSEDGASVGSSGDPIPFSAGKVFEPSTPIDAPQPPRAIPDTPVQAVVAFSAPPLPEEEPSKEEVPSRIIAEPPVTSLPQESIQVATPSPAQTIRKVDPYREPID